MNNETSELVGLIIIFVFGLIFLFSIQKCNFDENRIGCFTQTKDSGCYK